MIFCSSSQSGIDPKYDSAAKELVRALVERDYTVVSGGTRKGTMGVVSDEVVAAGGRHVGVIPRFMESVVARELTETVWVDTMSERKDKMREGTCAAVSFCLPPQQQTLHYQRHCYHQRKAFPAAHG